MRTDKIKISDDIWKKRIAASRQRRKAYEDTWQFYARLHSDGKDAVNNPGSDYRVTLGDKDEVKVSLVFRNLEQTMGYLELEDFGVSAQANSFTREQTSMDTQHQAVVEQGIYNSLNLSGLFQGADRLDQIKLDALICGHGISYSSWETVQEETVVDRMPLLEEKDGTLQPKFNKSGEREYEEVKEVQSLYEGVRDDRISPMQFLMDSTATSIGDSSWLGFESVMSLDELKADDRYDLPADIKPTTFEIKTLAGDETPDDDYYQPDSVRIIIVWDSTTRQLIHFLECADPKADGKKQKNCLQRIYEVRHPVRFDHPGDSPFNWFVPIPRSDDPFGISQIEHIRIPALEADVMRTRRANIARKQTRFMAYDKNKVEKDDVDAALNSEEPLEAIGIDVQDDADISRLFKEVQSAGVPDELLRYAKEPEEDVRQNSGVQETPFTGADTATESEIQRMIGQARINRKRNKLFKFLKQEARTHLAFLREFAPQGQQIAITLPDGTQQMASYGRDAFQGQFHLDVTPGGGASAISPIKQKHLTEAYQVIGDTMGPQAKLMISRQILTNLDVANLNAIMKAGQDFLLSGGLNAPGQGGQPAQAASPGQVNNGQAIREAVNPME